MVDHDSKGLLTAAKNDFNSKAYSNAILNLVKLLKYQNYRVRALSNIGACLFELGLYRAAKIHLMRALEFDTDYMPARLNLAKTLYALSDYAEAEKQFIEFLSCDQHSEEAWQGRFESCFAQKEIDKCHSILHEWPIAGQNTKPFFLASAVLFRHEGQDAAALRFLHQAAAVDAKDANIFVLMTEILLANDRLCDAIAAINRAISLDPENIFYLCVKANIYYFQSDIEKCADAFRDAAANCPKSAVLLLNQHLLFPVIPASAEQINECRARFMHGLEVAESTPELKFIYQHPISLHTFTLAYHNQNDRALLERYCLLMKKIGSGLLADLKRFRSKTISTKPLEIHQCTPVRIGFISRYFYGHSNLMAFQGLIRNLDRTEFHVIIIHVSGSKDDEAKASINSFADEVVNLSNNLYEIYNQLHDLRMDVLYFTDLGMTPYDFLFPFFRASPIQLTGWGIPHTSGNDCIDFYISSDGIEPDNAETLYSEKLVKLPGGLPCCFHVDSFDTPDLGREYFFLPYHCKLIGCLQSLHKLHPDFDFLLEAVAIKNPDAIFVFVEDAYSSSTELFLNRLALNAPSVKEQVLFLKLMSRWEYQALTKCMDIVLDPIYYGSGITFFEAVLVGTPIVTLEGSYLRSRVVASGYHEMGIYNAPIAYSHDEYSQLVRDLLEDDEKRNSLRRQILFQRHRIVNRGDYVRHFEDFCLKVTSRRAL